MSYFILAASVPALAFFLIQTVQTLTRARETAQAMRRLREWYS